MYVKKPIYLVKKYTTPNITNKNLFRNKVITSLL